MSDQERIRQREHWQAIAEQLGLSPDPELERPVANERVAAPAVSGTPVSVSSSATVGPVEPFEAQPDPKDETRPSHPVKQEPEGAQQTATVDRRLFSEDVSSREERQAKSGRRRRTAKIPSATESSAHTDLPAEGPPVEGTAAARKSKGATRRGRGRKRRRDEPAEANSSWTGDEAGAPEVSPFVAEAEADESEDAYNWDVPSWNELIGSLYRPER
jgi:hypothetical protein